MEAGPCTVPVEHNANAQSRTSHSPCSPQFDPYWNFPSVVFQVENILFSVLKYGFMVKGTPFETMFSTLPVDPMNVEGSRPDIPIVLEDTSAEDFRAFLRMLYPKGVPKLEKHEEWLGVLRLAHKWDFVKIREKAIIALDSHVLFKHPHEQIDLGNTFLVPKWLKQGLSEVALIHGLGFDELMGAPHYFDQRSVAKIFYIQSKAWKMKAQGDFGYAQEMFRDFVRNQVATMFAEEISRATYVPPSGWNSELASCLDQVDNKRKRQKGSV